MGKEKFWEKRDPEFNRKELLIRCKKTRRRKRFKGSTASGTNKLVGGARRLRSAAECQEKGGMVFKFLNIEGGKERGRH